MSDRLDAESLRRLNTWTWAIAQALRPDAPFARTAEGIRLGRKGSLSITADARWFDHEVGTGGRDALSFDPSPASMLARGSGLLGARVARRTPR